MNIRSYSSVCEIEFLFLNSQPMQRNITIIIIVNIGGLLLVFGPGRMRDPLAPPIEPLLAILKDRLPYGMIGGSCGSSSWSQKRKSVLLTSLRLYNE